MYRLTDSCWSGDAHERLVEYSPMVHSYHSCFARNCVAITLVAFGCGQSIDSPKLEPSKSLASPPPIVTGPATLTAFASSEWEDVWKAKREFEADAMTALPLLVTLLERDEIVKLQNTADLIYPGAETFYGHGWVIDYDLDWISARAGWAIEEIAFEDFGFSEHRFRKEVLLQATLTGVRDVPLDKVMPLEKQAEVRGKLRTQAIERALTWWKGNEKPWNRRGALIAALKCDNPVRVNLALHWLRFGDSPIDGLGRAEFYTDLAPTVTQLASSADESLADQAKLLLDEAADVEWGVPRLNERAAE